jgi:hypothetical protein
MDVSDIVTERFSRQPYYAYLGRILSMNAFETALNSDTDAGDGRFYRHRSERPVKRVLVHNQRRR